MDTAWKQQLGQALSEAGGPAGELVLRDETQVDQVGAGFLKNHGLYRALYRGRTGPVLFFVLADMPGHAVVTTGNPEAFLRVVREEGISLASPEQAVEYFVTFLQATRSTSRLFYLLEGVNGIRFLSRLSEEERHRAEAVRSEYEWVIVPAQGIDADGRFLVTCFAMVERDLVRIDGTVRPAGEVEVRVVTLEESLPAVASR